MLKTYIFTHKTSSVISIKLELYRDRDEAIRMLGYHVQNTNDWVLSDEK